MLQTALKGGCPYCGNRMVLKGFNDLQTVRPDIAQDWDYKKTGTSHHQMWFQEQTNDSGGNATPADTNGKHPVMKESWAMAAKYAQINLLPSRTRKRILLLG
jgi:hypothetical protein